MFAYTGIFRLEGDKWTTEVDVAWNPVWNGTDQVRSFKRDGGRRKVTSAWGERVNLGKMTRAVVMWKRAK
jgi:hypothetical protein